MSQLPTLSLDEHALVYNMLSLTIAAMLASFVFFVLSRGQLHPRYRPAMILSSLVVAIAGYHYIRIFNSWESAYHLVAGVYQPTGTPFNDAYRYVDWLLTVPLLVAELIAVLALAPALRGKMMAKLVIAAVLMIGLGYPGEIAGSSGMRVFWAILSTIPFAYILYVLWVELARAAATESAEVRDRLGVTRWVLLATWGFYPIAYAMPLFNISGASATVGLQVGYSIADILAKCGYGFLIYSIARKKMDSAGESLHGDLVAAQAARVG